MRTKLVNATHIEGILYQHNLEEKTTGANAKNPNTVYIAGTIDIATDNALTNIVQVHFSYVTPTTSKGKTNATYSLLYNIITGKIPTYLEVGEEKAAMVSVNSAIGLNEFYTEKNNVEELVSVKRNEGGFVSTVKVLNEDESARNTFDCDIIINKVTEVEANEEQGTDEKAIISGYIFDFRGEILPVEFSATNRKAMDYFLSLDASSSEPVFTRVWGNQISETIVKKTVIESAFGPDQVRETTKSRKDYVINGANRETYVWDEDITTAELKELIDNRETTLATLKQRQDEYKAQKAAAATAPTAPKTGEFKF